MSLIATFEAVSVCFLFLSSFVILTMVPHPPSFQTHLPLVYLPTILVKTSISAPYSWRCSSGPNGTFFSLNLCLGSPLICWHHSHAPGRRYDITFCKGHKPRLGKVSTRNLVQAPTIPVVIRDQHRVCLRLRWSFRAWVRMGDCVRAACQASRS